ncbi:MAG: hypothetical protein RL338_10, partial [Chloroflexota bacterium]
ATTKAFSVTVNGKPVTGTVRWAEDSTVLVLKPKAAFPAGAKVTLTVGTGATSIGGRRVEAKRSASFTVSKADPRSAAIRPIPIRSAPGMTAFELFALELMNCTRTGGWVLSNGSCRGGGTRAVAPLKLDAGISDKVARPYATYLASRRLCHHFYDGNPGYRLRRAGYTSWNWAENVGGCGSNSPRYSILSTHIYFQSEKSYNGGHYRNIMNPLYDRVGIGIVKVNGVLRMVVNFYRP